MINKKQALVVDIDGTLCTFKQAGQSYMDVQPLHEIIERLREYKARGFHVILYTSRNMRTYDGNIGLINAHTAPLLLDWLKKHDVPFDELHFGKPWPGDGGFYVDDRAIRPDEFKRLTYDEIVDLLGYRAD